MNPYKPWQRGWLPNEVLDRAIARVAHYAHGTLLDLGSGQQPYRALVERHITRYVSLDYPSKQYRNPRTSCHGDALAMPFRDAAFDTILCCEVLEHLCDPLRCFQEVARVLRVGGHLILTTPHIWGLHDEPNDFYRFTPYGLRYLALRYGLRPVSIEPTSGFWVTAGARLSYYLTRFHWRLEGPLGYPAHWIIQRGALMLDRLLPDYTDAFNHVLVAQRRAKADDETLSTVA